MSAPTEGVVEEQETPADDVEEQDEAPEPTGKRAARQRAEAAEARATAAEERVTRLQRAEVTRIASAVLAVGADVLAVDLGGATLESFLDDEGEVDVEAVREAAEAVVEARPGLRAARRVSSGSPDGGARQSPPGRDPSWADVIGRQR